MCNIDPIIYAHVMLKQEQAQLLYDLRRAELTFAEYKKRIKEQEEHTDKKRRNKT